MQPDRLEIQGRRGGGGAVDVLESSVVRSILRLRSEYPGLVLVKTLGGPGRRGLPDLLGCYRGRALAWEVKRPGMRATPLQAAELRRWGEAGAVAATVHSADEARLLLECAEAGNEEAGDGRR
jgi:hypothetical protein